VDTSSRGSEKKLRQDRLEHNTTQFFHGCRVLRSGGPNNVNHHIHLMHLELTTKRLNAFPIKEPQRAAAVAAPVEVSQKNTSIFGASGREKHLACGANR
jgi:hypothetical protein